MRLLKEVRNNVIVENPITDDDIETIYYAGLQDGIWKTFSCIDTFAEDNYGEGTPEYRAVRRALKYAQENKHTFSDAARKSNSSEYARYVKDFLYK